MNAIVHLRRRTLTVALGVTGVWVLDARRPARGRVAAQVRYYPIEPLPDGESRWPGLASVLRETGGRGRGRCGALSVALLPPLVELRPVELPPLKPDEALSVITRNAARYFLGAREAQVVGVSVPPRVRRGPARPVIAAAAPARLVEAIHRAACDGGWTVRVVVPAEAVWCRAALAIWPPLRRGAHGLVVAHADRLELLRLESGFLTGVRRFRPAGSDLPLLREALGRDGGRSSLGPLAVLGDARSRELVGRACASEGPGGPEPPAAWRPLADDPELAAAAFAARTSALELAPDSVHRQRRERRARWTAAAAVAAAGLFVVAAGLERWGVERALRAVERERAALAPRITTLERTRELAASASTRLEALAAQQRSATRWSEVLVTLTTTLPRDAYLTAFRGEGDSLRIDGLAARASAVFDALAAAPGFTQVHTAAPVRRELRERDPASGRERFSLAARLTPKSITPRPARVARAAGRPAGERPAGERPAGEQRAGGRP